MPSILQQLKEDLMPKIKCQKWWTSNILLLPVAASLTAMGLFRLPMISTWRGPSFVALSVRIDSLPIFIGSPIKADAWKKEC
jgi:hypothetical protein